MLEIIFTNGRSPLLFPPSPSFPRDLKNPARKSEVAGLVPRPLRRLGVYGRALFVLIGFGVLSCGGETRGIVRQQEPGGLVTGGGPIPSALIQIGGDGQTAQVGSLIPDSLLVRVVVRCRL